MSKPRIYIAIATFYPLVGGIEKLALMQSRYLHEKGYAATIVTFRHNKAWAPNEVIDGVNVIRVAGMLLGRRGKLPRFMQKAFYVLALGIMGWALWQGRRNYDVLHVHQLNLLALPAALACWLTGKPMAVVVHSTRLAIPHDQPALIAGPLDATAPWLQVHEQNQVGGDLEDLQRLGKPAIRFTRMLLHHIRAVIIILSSRMQTYLAAHDLLLPTTQPIPVGVDTTLFRPDYTSVSIEERTRNVICVSRLCYQKGIDVLLQAWYLVHEQMPQARLIIVGDGPLRSQLECMTEALGLTHCVEFMGTQTDVVTLFHRALIAVLSSRWEGMPATILEAMACGLPCVATRVSGSEDIIQHGVNGLLIEYEDYKGLAQALLTLLHDPQLAQQYGCAARATVEKHFSLEHMMNQYMDLYQRIVRGDSAIDAYQKQSVV